MRFLSFSVVFISLFLISVAFSILAPLYAQDEGGNHEEEGGDGGFDLGGGGFGGSY